MIRGLTYRRCTTLTLCPSSPLLNSGMPPCDGLYSFRGGQWVSYAALGAVIPRTRNILQVTSDGYLWIAGLGSEAVRLDYATERWESYEGLSFRCETQDGSLWFVSADDEVVSFDGSRWLRYGPEDGLMERPNALLATGMGDLWVGGSQGGLAATGRLEPDRSRWSLELHPHVSGDIDNNSALQDAEGDLWFGATDVAPGQLGGLLRYDGAQWRHYSGAEALLSVYASAQTPDGLLWFGGPWLRRFDGDRWTLVDEPKGLGSWIHDLLVTREGHLWVGTRSYGAYVFDGQRWAHYGEADGLRDNLVSGIHQLDSGRVLVTTSAGIRGFDGHTWVPYALPSDVGVSHRRGSLSQSSDGSLWINLRGRTLRYVPDGDPPQTRVTFSLREVSAASNTNITWSGSDPWQDTSTEDLEYVWRVDDDPWSGSSRGTSHQFLSLPHGQHTFEVKARDRDGNEDPTPALMQFTVLPPVWRQPWFVAMVGLLLGTAVLQSVRVVRRNTALTAANHGLNREIEERRRAEEERARLDQLLEELRYLDRLRDAIGGRRTTDEIIEQAGKVLVEILATSTSGGVEIQCGGQTWQFGTLGADQHRYDRPLVWGERERGHFRLYAGVALRESQQRALVDETTAQITRALESQELISQLLHSARLVSLGQTAAGVAHELNQPLTAISLVAQDIHGRLLEGEDPGPSHIKAMMADMLGFVQRMTGIIGHLRAFSRDASEEPEQRFDLNTVVHASLKVIGAQLDGHGVRLDLDLAEDVPQLLGHPHQVEQVLLNLLANARDAVDERHADTLDADRCVRVRTGCHSGDRSTAVLEVEDNGPGMDASQAERIFEPFFTTKGAERGTGLGLSISNAIVINHGGRIECESVPGAGSTFRVFLPTVREA